MRFASGKLHATVRCVNAHGTLDAVDRILQRGIELFDAGRYFDSHEVLEEAWGPERGPRRLFLQGLIHVAVAFYHQTQGNPTGAIRQLRKALRKLAPYGPVWEGVDVESLCREAGEILAAIESGEPVPDLPKIPIRAERAAP